MSTAFRLAVIVFTFVATTGTSRADDLIWGSAYQNPWSSWDAYRYKSVEAESKAVIEKHRGKSSEAAAKHRPLKATDFKRSKGRPMLDEYMASSGLEGADAEALRAAIEVTIDAIESNVRKDNVASSMSALYAASYYALQGQSLDDATEDQMTTAFNDALAADPGFKKLKARDKQMLSDTVLIQAALVLVYVVQEDATSQETAKTFARGAMMYLVGTETGFAAQ